MRAIFLAALLMLTLPGHAQPPGGGGLERQVLAAINQARANPAAYAETLRRYRGYFQDKVVHFPGNPVGLRTKEGPAAVDEAIAFLSRQQPLPPLGDAPILARAAADHAADLGPGGRTGHKGQDGSGPGDRVRRHGGGGAIAETISYGAADAAGVVRQLVVDDGVPSRGHRKILFDPTYRFAGAGCGGHAAHRSMCVINLSSTAGGRLRTR